MGEDSERADADRAVVLHGHAAQFVQLLDGDQFFSGAAAFAHLHKYVGAARDDLRLGMLDAELTGVCDTGRFVERFDIIHDAVPPLSPESDRPL